MSLLNGKTVFEYQDFLHSVVCAIHNRLIIDTG